jgi:Ca2+-binding EF-hand superfamily protein
LEEVWEKEDHLEKDQFDPKAFFALHDTNNDGYLTADEVEALFNVEVGIQASSS